MRKTITIACALLLAAAACGTPSLDGSDTEPDAVSGTEPVTSETSEAIVETDGTDGAADASTATTTTSTTTTAQAPATTRAPSDAAGAQESSTTAPQSSEEDNKGGGDDAVTGQVPTHLMDQVFAHAEGHTGVSASTMRVLRAESVTWPDGSLGCPEPGMQYTQALVPGYWVEIAVGDDTLDYRLSEQGGMKLCETGGLIPSPRDDT